jgi:hypothetical protein
VQEKFEDVDAVLDQVLLEIINVPVTPTPEITFSCFGGKLLLFQLLRVDSIGDDLLII